MERLLLSTTSLRRLYVALLPRDVAQLPAARAQFSSNRLLASESAELLTAVVIDTLRFTTTACQALQSGAHSVWIAAGVEQAQQLARQRVQPPLLCGERHCHRIAGFDLGNSPFEYTAQAVQNRELVFTTTNGTLAIEAVADVPRILLAALVNRTAVCQHLLAHVAGDIIVVCAGTDGHLTWEDVLTAGAIVNQLSQHESIGLGDDSSRLAQAAWRASVDETWATSELTAALFRELSQALGGRNLMLAGYERDVRFASQLDALDVVPHNGPSHPRSFTK